MQERKPDTHFVVPLPGVTVESLKEESAHILELLLKLNRNHSQVKYYFELVYYVTETSTPGASMLTFAYNIVHHSHPAIVRDIINHQKRYQQRNYFAEHIYLGVISDAKPIHWWDDQIDFLERLS